MYENIENLFFISDTHFSHRNILIYEPERLSLADISVDAYLNARENHKNKEEEIVRQCDIALAHKISEQITPGATLVHLGDVFFKHNDYDHVEEVINIMLMNVKEFVWVRGNHDEFQIEMLHSQLEFYHALTKVSTGGQFYWVDDELISEEELHSTDLIKKIKKDGFNSRPKIPRFYLNHYLTCVWPGQKKNVIHLHGHSHGSIEDFKRNSLKDKLAFDVGVMNISHHDGVETKVGHVTSIEELRQRRHAVISKPDYRPAEIGHHAA